MNNFEYIYKKLEYLFIEKLPEYIEKVNKDINDGIILKPFMNKTLDEDCIKLPNIRFSLSEAEYTEKDRIIENCVFNFNIEIRNHNNIGKSLIELYRYYEAIERLINENKEDFLEFRIIKNFDNKVFFRIVA